MPQQTGTLLNHQDGSTRAHYDIYGNISGIENMNGHLSLKTATSTDHNWCLERIAPGQRGIEAKTKTSSTRMRRNTPSSFVTF